MKKKLRVALLFVAFVAVLLESCNNIFHNLLPPPNNEIISFAVQYSDGTRSASSDAIENQTITVTVPDGTDLTNLIPVVTVSEKATVIPGTLPYLNKVFPERDLMHLAVQMNNAFNDGTFKDWFLKLVLESDKVSIPRLDMPVDFSVPVFFCVISGDGNYKLYTVKVLTETEKIIEETGEIPPGADNFILSFEVPGQREPSVIIHEGIDSSSGTVDFVVEQGTNIRSLLPAITVSEGAKIIPLTMEYIMNCGFTFDQMLGFYTGYSTATDIEKYVSSFLRRATNIVYPEITTPMDFSSSVPFAVVGSDGGVRVYNANCSVYDGTPKLEKVYFSKANNPYLIKDFECESSLDSFIGQATYPDEMELDYGLIADIVFIGEKVTYSINGGAETEIVSGVTVIPFTSGNRTCTITVYREGNTKTYNLTVERFLDPDTIRSITDYRFKKQNNSDIKNTVIASIYNEGDTGYISATVLYEGSTAPYDLVVDFISPGTVTTAYTIEGAVPGTTQTSGVTSNNFQYSRKFLCTSRNGLYTRLYTVNIEFVQVIPAEVAIKSFTFPVYLNGDLSQDAVATINDADGSIRCQVTYASENVPKSLVAEFSATGAVTCSGITQTSGYTANNFTYSQYYTVTVQDEYYGTLTKNYKVEVVYKKDNDSACELLTFGFATEDNPTLTSDVNATVTQRNGSVYAFMPFGAGATEGNALVPFFTAEGTVTVNGQTQTSGISSQDFSSPVTYTVTSANGLYTKEYVVSLQESGSIIYVDINAVGRNNGTSWDDAFINLDTALEYVSTIDESILQEVWITADEYEPILNSKNGFNIRSNLILRGGFEGTESASNDRLVDSENCLVNHTVLKRQPLNSVEESLFYANENFTGTFTIDGFDIDLEQTANETFLDITKVLNPIDATENSKVEVNNCLLSVKTQNGGCRLFYSEKDSNDLWDTATKPTNNIKILNTKINADTLDGMSVTSHTGEVLIQNTKTNCKLSMVGKSVTIEDTSFDNQLYTITEKPDDQFYLTNLNDADSFAYIKNSYFNNLIIKAYYDVTMEDSVLENVALHSATNGLSNLNILNTTLNLVNINGYALEYGSLCMKNSTMEANTCRGSNLIQIEDSEFTVYNLKAWVSFQNTCYYEGNSFIKNSTITTTGSSVVLGGYIGGSTQYYASKDFCIENSNFIGYEIYFYSENLTIKDSAFSFPPRSSLFHGLYFGTKNLVLEGNEFDINETQITSTTLPVWTYRLYFNDGITMESSEIKDNTFDHFMQLFFYSNYNDGTDVRYYNFENNYFKTSSWITSSGTINLNFINNTFEDLEYIDAQNATISKYENNKVVNKNSSRGYKCIRVKEFSYTEFNYENFCYFNSSGELSFNNCIIEPCTQTYSLPQGDFTFRSSIGNGDFITPLDSYITLNNCIVNSDFENDGTVVVEECTNFQIGRLDNYGDFTINDSSVTGTGYIDNSSTLTINNSNINLTSTDGTNILQSTGNLSINGGTFNLKSTQGGNSLNAKGSISINGGTFNFEHSGSYAPFYVGCDATISNAKFNFTGEEYTGSSCVSFDSGTNGSTINNCKFTIDKCAKYGIYIYQELTIEDSEFDINVYPENSGDVCMSFFTDKDVTISNSKFNFTGDVYTTGKCVYFQSGTNGSTIKNCEFIIDKCTQYGFYAGQAGLKIENSKFDINLHQEELNSSNYAFYCYDEISFNNCEIICEDSYYGFYSVTGLNLIDCKTSLKKCKNMGIKFEGNLYINGGKLDIFESSNQGICSASANGSSLLIENCNVSLSDQLQNGILFTHIENGLISINNSFIGTNTRIKFALGGTTIIKDSILNCRYITPTSSTWPVIISNTSGVW